MSPLLFLAAQLVTVPADGIPQAVPATAFSCELVASDGSRFSVSGTTPVFAAGADPNGMQFVSVESSHPEAFRKSVAVTPGDASEWFREFQLSSGYPGVPQYRLNLLLRREGASVGYVTRHLSSGKPIPYEYYAAGLCKADFAPAASAERG